jgi:acetyl-CoA carboxylase carboxyltransferase component
MFETMMMETIYAMRAAQARYRYRLQWNRIIIYNRALLNLKFKQLQDYGQRLAERTRDLGLEKFLVYTRRKRWSEEIIRELELTFQSITKGHYHVGVRRPKIAPFEPLDSYAAKVLKSRQRNTVYPYEFISMLTSGGVYEDSPSPRGSFEEFDVKYSEASVDQEVISVKGRAPGLNESNIVFGIIQNELSGMNLKRVIILSDPTKDLGSLSEPECRRVNAALDLAEKEQIPVEWIPISSGAKITLESGTENLDWTASTLKRIIQFTQAGGEINIIVPGINVGAQSYWDAEATMLMHTRGLLIMTDDGSMLLTGKKALDFSGSISGETNLDIGGAEKIMSPNGQAQIRVPNLAAAYTKLFQHYTYSYVAPGEKYPAKRKSDDPVDRDVTKAPYNDYLGQGFSCIGDIFDSKKNGERKKPFDIRQVMEVLIDSDADFLERWQTMEDADTSIVWETQMGGRPVGMVGIESRPLSRVGSIPFDGPESWSGGTLFPQSSKKVARAINSFSGHLPLVVVANLSGFDGSPESLRRLQLEYGAEIGRAIVNFDGPIAFLVVSRYHGGAYVVFSKSLNHNLRAAALEGSYASVIGGAPAAAVVFPRDVLKEVYSDKRIREQQECLSKNECTQKEYDELFKQVKNEKQTEMGNKFDKIHSVERAKKVGSIDDIIRPAEMRPYLISVIEKGIAKTK